jgi:predicted RNA binding protein YcfA (HicA-like mRNA interferase family)
VSAELPPVSGARVVRALEQRGWYVKRIRGSHHAMRHPDIRDTVVVPVHRNRPVPRGTLGSILRTAQMSREEFRGLL